MPIPLPSHWRAYRGPEGHSGVGLARTDGSIRLRADLLQKPLALSGASTDGFTPRTKRAPVRHAPLDGKHPKGVVLSQILLSREREFLQIIQMFKIRRAHACRVELLAIESERFHKHSLTCV